MSREYSLERPRSQKLVWKRMGFGIPTRASAEELATRCRKEWGKETKVRQGKMGYSVLCRFPSFKRKLGE